MFILQLAIISTNIMGHFRVDIDEHQTLAVPLLLHKNHLNSSTLGPSLNFIVGTSFAVSFTPCRRFRRWLSHNMKRPKHPVTKHPTAPKQAVVIRAGAYLGASLA